MLDEGDDGAGYFVVKIWANAAKLTDTLVAGFRQSRYRAREWEMFVENKAKVTIKVSCVKWAGAYFSQLLLFESNEEKFRIRRVESQEIGIHPWWERSVDEWC